MGTDARFKKPKQFSQLKARYLCEELLFETKVLFQYSIKICCMECPSGNTEIIVNCYSNLRWNILISVTNDSQRVADFRVGGIGIQRKLALGDGCGGFLR